MMLPSRSVRKRLPRASAPSPRDRPCAGPSAGDVSRSVPDATAMASGASGTSSRPILLLRLLHSRARARSFVAALGRGVRLDRGLVQELEARVDVGGARQPLADVVQVQLEDREEALEVGLLVDCELDLARAQELLGDRGEVVAAALDALRRQPVLVNRLGGGLGVAAFYRE